MFMQYPKPELVPRSFTLVIMACAWLAGIILDAWLLLPAPVLLIAAGAAFALTFLLWQDTQGRILLLGLLCLLLGAWRYASVSPIGDPQAISAFIGPQKLIVRGAVADEPSLQGRSRILIVEASRISTNGGKSWQAVHGQIKVQTLGSLIEDPYGANYGDSVEVQGKLQVPLPPSPPGIFAEMVFPHITVSSSGGNPIIAALYRLRVALANVIERTLPQPQAALLIALVLGLRTPALEPLKQAFSVTGTAHLIVPSGFKVTILAGLVASIARWLYEKPGREETRPLLTQKSKEHWRRWLSTALVIASIAAYTVLSGAGPAAVRAGIMGIVLIIAPRIGRAYNVYTALALAALLMSLFDPFMLWDAGFQLSFAGTLGIVLLTPFFQHLLHPFERFPSGHYVVELIAVTLAAQTATLPIFCITFQLVSFIAPVTNLFTVPLLGVLILLGALMCIAGVVFPLLALICGWVVGPLLQYVIVAVTWTSALPGAYVHVDSVSTRLAWAYYALLALIYVVFLRKWSLQANSIRPRPFLSRHTWRMIQAGSALLMILATTTQVLAAQPDGRLTISFLDVGPAGQPAQGEAIFVRTPDGKTMVIDGGLDAVSLGQAVDGTLPFWKRALDLVMLTTDKADYLAGLQDSINRYQVGEVIDAGVLHPSASYALWRRTITEQQLPYAQVRQGATIALGTQVELQVLWPPSPLHKSSSEVFDNTLVVRLLAPGLRLLLLGAAALSKFALNGLLSSIDPNYLRANVVQIVGEVGKVFPVELSALLQAAHPQLLVVTPAGLSARQRKAGATVTTLSPSALMFDQVPAQVVQTAQAGTLEIGASASGWTWQAG